MKLTFRTIQNSFIVDTNMYSEDLIKYFLNEHLVFYYDSDNKISYDYDNYISLTMFIRIFCSKCEQVYVKLIDGYFYNEVYLSMSERLIIDGRLIDSLIVKL